MLKTFFLFIMLIGTHPAFSQDAELVLPYGHQKKITKVIISSDEKTLLTASEDHSISAWVLQTGQETRKFKWHTRAVNDIALSSNNRYLVSVSGDGKALLWNALTGKILKVVPHGYDPVRLVKFAPRTNFFVTTHYLEHRNESVLRFFSIPACEMVKEFTFADEHILDFVISEKMASVIVLTNTGILYRIDGNPFERISSKHRGNPGVQRVCRLPETRLALAKTLNRDHQRIALPDFGA